MSQLEHIEAIEKRLWSAADNLRANSNYASNEYFMPVMGLVFLRHAYSRYLSVKEQIEPKLPSRGGKTRDLTKEDFSQQSAIYLRPKAQFDTLVALPDSADRARAIIEAMESIEADYDNLRGILPKGEFQELDNQVLGQLLRTLNPEELKKVKGDVFGRIYEYFLTQFAGQGAHDGGEFFTPVSLVSLIAHVLDPERGTVLDPACGSGGMFVQSARIVEEHGDSPTEKLTFRGLEKNATTIRLAKMNLAVHGLEGDIQKAITYYEDPHELVGRADYVMANPPFNVDEIDADKVKSDPRLPFGLPGVNKKNKVSNGNYIWISYFYSYLSDKGRAGFVMSSQASSAGGGEARLRQKLVETGDVDVMIAIRSNFFYTRTVPCELWFFNRDKPKAHKAKVLMIDARNVYRKVTRKIYDFSPEQQQNLLAIVWLYRGETDRYLQLVSEYLGDVTDEAYGCFAVEDDLGQTFRPLPDFSDALKALRNSLASFLKSQPKTGPQADVLKELEKETDLFEQDIEQFRNAARQAAQQWDAAPDTNAALLKLTQAFEPIAEQSRDLIKQTDLIYKLATRLIDTCESECHAKDSDTWVSRDITRARKAADEARGIAVEQLKQVRYLWKQAHWLTERFPEAQLRDVEGLVKLVDLQEIEANDWSLTPGRYVGVVPEEVDEDFDFEETLREIHVELEDLNAEAVTLAATIKRNFEELGV
ncbi:N-6 DNA methylase [Acidithiobacillus ferrivorans SS3]|uniref:site-specific DNA-methyltransferase (adenine-specific) n=1 Tax=Acidithiobacillus ferrivorans SS3 TaxID=743299 RepID=G0JLB8_9PROT|nr:N-6 DNA methylase [Acidithiobacillus ferrivorans]AEM46870.1 N-6 DNA methylase [Acidithiobacillus ferrivorans SS3]OFA16361.1 DNA methyltransferase [Acidithiobacillus ferrivorans]